MKLLLVLLLVPLVALSDIVNQLQSQANNTLVKVLPDKIVFMDLKSKVTNTLLGDFSNVDYINLSPNGENYLLVKGNEIQFFNKKNELVFNDKTTNLGKISSISYINNKTPVIGTELGIIDIFKKENGSYKKISKQFSELPIVNIYATDATLIIEHRRYHKPIGYGASPSPTHINDLPRENIKYRPAGFNINESDQTHSGFMLEKLGFTTEESTPSPISKEHLENYNNNRKASNQRDLFVIAYDQDLKNIEGKIFIDDYTNIKVNQSNNHFILGLREENIMNLVDIDSGNVTPIPGYGDIVEFDTINKRILLTNTDDQVVRVIDSTSGQLIKEFSSNLKGIRAMKIIEDQLILASENGVFEKRLLANLDSKAVNQHQTQINISKYSDIKIFGDTFSILEENGERVLLDINYFSRCNPLLR